MIEPEALRAVVIPPLDDLRRFIDRRFAELSMEINATSQMMDFSEANLTGQISAMKEQIAAMVALPAASTRNSGVELEAVVQATEAAANRIMEAAEAIGEWMDTGRDDPAIRQNVNDKVSAIFEACSFQDLTSQRIRRAIDHLRQVETMLGSLGSGAPAPEPKPQADFHATGDDMAQAEIDKLMADF